MNATSHWPALRRSGSRIHVGYTYRPGAMVSPSGHCRPFDAHSDGTIFGSGVAALILKPLQAALDDGDRIHAVIRGSAVNNDGALKMTYAAPTVSGQVEVIAERRPLPRSTRRPSVSSRHTAPVPRWATRSRSSPPGRLSRGLRGDALPPAYWAR